ncbi:phytosulfokines 3-like [Lotus japonicus]|uniref:Phytosulfokine n=1 Tax=Lotus japonicus TaxID=34305 RepID=A0A097C2W5_LOTJA|nr:phytosulfokines 3-like [Lotus japonicus]AIS76459.1 phytosulfokine-alpha precursor 2 [Lotus japonicus]
MKMWYKLRVFMATFFFLFLTLTYATRLGPASSSVISKSNQHGVLEEEMNSIEEACQDIGEDECLMRRTLAAHTDYIYTQKQKP